MAYPPSLANALANLLAHAEVLLARQGPVDALFEEATSAEAGALAGQLAGALQRERGQREAAAKRYEQGILGVLGALALFWIVLAVQQRARGAARGAPEVVAVPAGTPGGEAQPAAPVKTEPVLVPSFAGAGAELAGAGPEAPPGLSAEAALLHRLLAERVGGNLAAAAGRIATRMDYLRQSHHKLQHALQGSEHFVELPGGTDLDEELEASTTVAAHVGREVNAIADLARRLGRSRGCRTGTRSARWST